MTSDGRAVGVPDIESTPSVDDVVQAVEAAGARPRVGTPESLADSDLRAIVAPGDDAFERLGKSSPDAPLLPVGVGPGVRSVAPAELAGAVQGVVDARVGVDHHDVVDVSVDGARVGRFLRDATLLTSEPARISEFAVESDAVGHVDEVRSDGVVVTTPAGSHGYAAAGNGPLLAPTTGLAVVPIAPFRIDRSRWVLPPAPLSVQIQRDEADVTVEVDGEDRQTVGKDANVTFVPTDTVETIVVEQSRPLFE